MFFVGGMIVLCKSFWCVSWRTEKPARKSLGSIFEEVGLNSHKRLVWKANFESKNRYLSIKKWDRWNAFLVANTMIVCLNTVKWVRCWREYVPSEQRRLEVRFRAANRRSIVCLSIGLMQLGLKLPLCLSLFPKEFCVVELD